MSHQTHLIMASAPSGQKTSVLGTACVGSSALWLPVCIACRMQGSVLRPLLAALKGCVGSFAFCLAGCHSDLYCLHLTLGPRLYFFLYFPVLNGHHWEQADRVELLLEAITVITEVAAGPGKLMGHLKYSQINGIKLST